MKDHPSHPSTSPVVEPKARQTSPELPAALRASAPVAMPKAGYDRYGKPYVDPRTAVAPPVPALAVVPVATAWPDPRNTAYAYDPTDPMPPTAEPGVLEILAGSRGRSALDECVSALRDLDRRLADAKGLDAAGRVAHERPREWADRLMGQMLNFGRTKPQYHPASADVAERRGIYYGRCVALARILSVELGPLIDPRFPTVAEARAELGQVVGGIAGLSRVAADADQYGRLGVQPALTVADHDETITRAAEARAELMEAPRRAWEAMGPRAAAERVRRCFGQDILIESLNTFSRRKAQLADQVAELEKEATRQAALAAEVVKATAGRVKRAVDAAGGNAAVASAIVAALALSEPPRPVDHELGRIETNLADLAAAGVEAGPSIDSATNRRDALTAEAAESARGRASARKARAASMLERAAAGESKAVAEIVALGVASPHAFPGGFVAGLAG